MQLRVASAAIVQPPYNSCTLTLKNCGVPVAQARPPRECQGGDGDEGGTEERWQALRRFDLDVRRQARLDGAG
eukprot:3379858-Rhodomonas_salina.1